MNWDAIGAIGEWVGALAVVATLGYLAVQVRHNTRSLGIGSTQDVTNQINALNMHLAVDSEARSSFLLCLNEPDSANAQQQSAAHLALRSYVNVLFQTWLLRNVNATQAELWQAQLESTAAMLRSPGGRIWFDRYAEDYGEEFRQIVSKARGNTTTRFGLDISGTDV